MFTLSHPPSLEEPVPCPVYTQLDEELSCKTSVAFEVIGEKKQHFCTEYCPDPASSRDCIPEQKQPLKPK